ncbi:formate/nitrite transporter family protein [Luteococcus sp. OSA5]|uniref:formate/nitrite transporter family protein n=1 Tax=Luteococcus sp. OSA5 TaxID=3401630 RepID=UPI003B42B4DE
MTLATERPVAATRPARDELELWGIGDMVERVIAVAVEKAHRPASMLVRSLIGGTMVAFGVLLSTTVSTGITIPGLSSMVMGLAFGFSFVLILVSGASLITADMAAGLIAVLSRRLGWWHYLRFLALGLLGNLTGALGFITVAAAAGGPYLARPFASNAVAIGTAKSGASNTSAFLLAILCTWFLQTAMFMFFKARTDVARMGFAFYGPFAFVVGGTQHVIANIAFIAFPMLLALFHPGMVPANPIGWGLGEHGLLRNLALTTAGNFVGGALLVAVPFWYAARLMQQDR